MVELKLIKSSLNKIGVVDYESMTISKLPIFDVKSMVLLKSIKTGNMQKYLVHFWSISANGRFDFDVNFWSNMSISVNISTSIIRQNSV